MNLAIGRQPVLVLMRLAAEDVRIRALLALVLGGMLAATQPPLHLAPLAVVSFTGLFWLLDRITTTRARFGVAFIFAYGYFVAGLYWTGIAFFVDAERFALLVPLPVLGLPLGLALFPASGIALALRWPAPAPGRVILLAMGWTAGEFVRSQVLTGFPWNLVGYLWAFSDVMLQAAALIGVHGLGLLTVAVAAMPGVLFGPGGSRRHWPWILAAGAILALMAAGGILRLGMAHDTQVPGVRLRLVQPNIEQYQKWRDDRRTANFARHVNLSLEPGAERITHFIWPETAIPYFLDYEPSLRAVLGDLVRGRGLLLTGAPRRTSPSAPDFAVWNSLEIVNGEGRIVAHYDKRHLVPFGEYLPLRPFLGRLGLEKLAVSSVDFSRGAGPAVIEVPGLPPVRVLICYEGIFPDEVWPAGELRPGWLLNVTNDGWFGMSSGPHQHFAMTRVRAIEQGLPLVRAANTGISAIVDAHGRVIKSLGLGESGVIDGPLPAALTPPPLYARFGEIGLAALLLAGLGVVRASRRFDASL